MSTTDRYRFQNYFFSCEPSPELFATNIAREWLFVGMNAPVLFQLVVSFERFATVLTFERPVIRVSQKVMTQIGRRAISVFRI